MLDFFSFSVTNEGAKAICIFNKDYQGQIDSLPGVAADKIAITTMLRKNGYDFKVKDNQNDIETCVDEIVQTWRHIRIPRLHFHYSGHGIFNNTETIDPSNVGECMVGTNGSFCGVLVVQKLLTTLNPDVITITLDCCRDRTRSLSRSNFMNLPRSPKIKKEDWEKMATLSSTCQTLTSSDNTTLSKELFKVYQEKGRIVISELAKKVNESWEKGLIGQRCKMDIVPHSKWDKIFWP